jgi:hypothetical protein
MRLVSLTAPLGQVLAEPTGGQFLAKATSAYPAWRRAEDAVRWLRGELQIKPTIKLAAEVFRVSHPRIKQAQARIEQRERNKRYASNGNGTTTLSDSALERLVAEVGIDRVWRAVDKLTQPQLPLQAAE